MDTVGSAVLFTLLPLVVGGLSGVVAGSPKSKWYQSLRKAPWNPPAYVFGPVWTILYVLMGYASFRVYQKEGVGPALGVYFAQLGVNALWSPVFFRFHSIRYALALIILLFLLAITTDVLFWIVDRVAGGLLIPYIVWLSFALSLNATIEPATEDKTAWLLFVNEEDSENNCSSVELLTL